MPTPRSPNVDKRSDERKQAEKIYLESKGSLKLVEIAEKLKVPANKVRKWKSMDGWEAKLSPTKADNGKKKQVERSTSDKGSVPRKRGAPKGNKNAVGGRGNPNAKPPDATKHGGYSAVYWDTLDEDEKNLIEDMPKDEEEQQCRRSDGTFYPRGFVENDRGKWSGTFHRKEPYGFNGWSF